MGTVAIEEVTGRIAENLECLKRFTATPGDGCTRLPFTKEARDAVNYLREVMTEAGLEVHEDEAGNIIGILKGENPDLPCVMMGSHYDSVVNGGDFDGIAGVVCAIEAARQLKDEGFTPKRNFAIVGFCDEEDLIQRRLKMQNGRKVLSENSLSFILSRDRFWMQRILRSVL